ncbi:flagellar protein FlaG [Helicobacter felis]|uniref:Flagellar protein FlaG n=1 Tax=Helicobacter felis (strain ATCC 49179 / CCUG 28539 / NCTC 12436 / CS1) TaxID=936155 RepID=E7ADC2_HELFC|nr:flagellar protein FlaG [Helicobacter felis]CBY83179.1 flagellar protein FlaG [Helicobacter felis ATCC 49179]
MSGNIMGVSDVSNLNHFLSQSTPDNKHVSLQTNPSEHQKTEVESLKQELTERDLQKLSKELNEKMKRMHSDITFSYNEDIGGLVVTIKDDRGNRVIREIPPQAVIELSKKMRDIVGILFDKKG